MTQAVGFIGDYEPAGSDSDPVFKAIRSAADIPAPLKRTEPGTDIFIVAYSNDEGWERDLTLSVVNNFWPAIQDDRMEFRVGSTIINSKTLGSLIQSFSTTESFEAHHFYQVYLDEKSANHSKNLRRLGNCSLRLTTSKKSLPKKICMVRKTGMVIYYYSPRACRIPFSGLFTCDDDKGNALLRQMEPPRHDIWDPSRIERDEGRLALKEIKDWIRDGVKGLTPPFTGSSFNESDLGKYLPDLETEADTMLPAETGKDRGEPGFFGSPSIDPAGPTSIPAEQLAAGSVEDSGVEDTGGEGGGDGTDVVLRDEEPNEEKDGKRKEKSPRGGDGGGKAGSKVILMMRSFWNSDEQHYVVTVRSAGPHTGSIRISAVGESGEKEPVNINYAISMPDRKPLTVEGGNTIRGLSIRAGEAATLILSTVDSRRYSLTGDAV